MPRDFDCCKIGVKSKATTEAVRAMAWLGRRERGVT
jgi:hypothetical protein